MPGPVEDRVLVWRVLPEITSITSEIGDLFNAYARLVLVPVGWSIDFREDDAGPMDVSITLDAEGRGYDRPPPLVIP